MGGVAGAKKKTVSPRNNTGGFQNGSPGPKILTVNEKGEDFAASLVESADGAGKHEVRNRLKSNNNQMKKVDEFADSTNIHQAGGKTMYYNTEKFGAHLLMNSDSHTALAAAKLSVAAVEEGTM